MTTVAAEAVRPGGALVWLALAKPRLNALAVATVGIGYYLGAPELDLVVLLCVVAGSALVAAGGAAFNQVCSLPASSTTEQRLVPEPCSWVL